MIFGFKEILWDSGAIWVIIILMFVSWIIQRSQIMIGYYKSKKKQ
jgi:hypothetical protein